MSFNDMLECSYLPLTEVLTFIVDNRGKTAPTAESGIPLIATNCIKNNELYPVFEKIRYISEETYKSWFRAHPIPGDIIFVNKGTPGRVSLVPDPVSFCIAQDMMALRADDKIINNKYLFAVLRSPQFQTQIEQFHVGTLIPHFKKGDLDKLLIPIPSMKIQEYIGETYYSLSNMIELNNRTNQVLEEMAQTIYKQWFVDFEFPNEDGQPYKSNGGEMIDGELGEIPKGWRAEAFEDVIDFQEGPGIRNWQYVLKDGTKFINIRCIRNKDLLLDTANMISNEEAEGKYAHFMLNEWDVVVSTSGTLGRYAIVRKEHLPLCLNTSVIRFKPKTNFNHFAYMLSYISSDEFYQHLITKASGSVQANFGPMHIRQISLKYPTEKIINSFQEAVLPLIKMETTLKSENQLLSSIRETLLPKLMSGEIRVPLEEVV